MKMKKQSFITILLTVLMSMAGAKASAYDIAVANADGVTIYYNYINNGVDLEVTEGDYSGNIKIPEEVIYRDRTRKVTAIGEYAFYECTSLTSVSIPNSVTFIKSQAFNGCSGLTSITIPSSVTSVGGNAFKECSSLTAVHISDLEAWCGIKFSDGFTNPLLSAHYLYLNGKEIKDLVIPNSVTAIGDWAFAGCSNLTSVTIPNSVTTIGKIAFYECSNLTSVTIPSSVTSIGNSAFYDCNNLTSVFMLTAYPFEIEGKASNARTFDLDVFNNSTLYVPTGTIDKYKATSGWKDFLYIEEISWIEGGQCGDKVYYSYDKTTHTLTIYGKGPMWSAEGFDVSFSWWSYGDDILHIIIESGVTSIGDYAFTDFINLTSVTIPNSVTSIGDWAFECCTSLTSITIPNSVTFIGNHAFSGCSALTSVTIPNSVNSIGGYAFYKCSGLKFLTIPNSVKSIGENAFSYCSGLTSVTIPNSVTYVGECAFSYCNGLTSIFVESGNLKYDSRNNCNAIIETSSNSLIVGCMNTIIPNNVTSIGEMAFLDCSGLTSVIIPNRVTTIGERAFEGCRGLTSITIPMSVTSIADYAFEGCSSLTSIMVESDNQIYDSRNNCNAIIETSSNNLIAGCMNTIIPNSVTSIDKYAFYGCSGLTSVAIPNSVTSIGHFAFDGCRGLTSITIPNSVTSIGNSTFLFCSGLTSVTIPNSVTSIGKYAFGFCSGIKDYYVWAEKVPSGYPFMSAEEIEEAILHVPAASVEIYRQTDPWSGFGRIVPLTDEDPTSIKGILQSDHLNGEYYDLTGRIVNNPKKGLYIKNGRKVIMK